MAKDLLNPEPWLPSHPALWKRVLARDADASFVYAVASTGIFCRPSCPSRRPALANVLFFRNAAEAAAAGYRACKRCAPLGERQDALLAARLCRRIALHREEPLTLRSLAKLAGCSPFTVQRAFTRAMGVSPRQYQAQLRADALRRDLPSRATVTEAIYGAGYGSSSRVYERVEQTLGMSPARFRDGGRGEIIRFATAPSALGLVLVAATERGICSVMMGEKRQELERELQRQFPKAQILPGGDGLTKSLSAVLAAIDGRPAARDLAFDIRATAFQARVWRALRQIPPGETRSYAKLSQSLGQPTATRAVARACASNPVAIVIPCHRVIGSDGSLTGYRWGVERKQKLLEMERERGRKPARSRPTK